MDYTKNHFEHEEAIQRKINFPEALEHKDEHRKLIATLNAVKVKLDQVLEDDPEDNDKPANEVTDDEIEEMLAEHIPSHSVSVEDLEPLAGLMRSWLVDHIIGNDLKMKPYLQKLPMDFT